MTMTDKISDYESTYKTFIFDHKWHSTIIGFIVGILMIAVYIWMLIGFVDLLITLYHSFPGNWAHGAEKMVKNVVIILASLELIRIFQSYLLLGRVKVTFILDVALVVLIGELIGFWYRDYNTTQVTLSIVVISVLVALRIVTMKFSPDCNEN